MAAIIDYRGKSPHKVPSGVPLITAKIVKDGRILPPEEFIAEEDYSEWMRRGIPEAGDILLTTEAPLGEVAQLDGRKVALAQRLITLRGKPELLDNRFLKFAMRSEFIQRQLSARATGTTVHGVRQSELRKVQLAIPPISEQRAIAHILGTLDDKIELNRRMNETLEAMARAIFKSWFMDFDPVRAKAEGRQPFGMDAATAALFPDSFQDSALGKMPKGWRVGKLSELCTTQYGYTASATEEPIGPRLLRVMDINKRNWIEWNSVPYCRVNEDDKSKYSVGIGDILVARMADPGKSAIIEEHVEAVFASYLVRLKTGSLATSYYVYGFLKSQAYEEYSQGAMSGSVQANMNAKVIVGADLVIPPDKLIDAYAERVMPLRRRIVANLRETSTLTTIRDALLPKLISGEIRVKAGEGVS
jgi:type I restriction enzyme, S subunit